jgi:WD40 repeat protein
MSKVSAPTAGTKNASMRKPSKMMQGYTGMVRCVVHLHGGRRIITCSYDGSLRLWDLESSTQIGDDWRDDGDKPGVLALALAPSGKTVATGSRDGTVRLWDVETEKLIANWCKHTDYVGSVGWSADGERVVSGSEDGTARVWDVKSGETVLGPIMTGQRLVEAVGYSPDMTKIATGGENENGIKIWDAKTGKLLFTIKHELPVWSLVWTSDQKKLISGSDDGKIRIFDTATWQQTNILEGHENGVYVISLARNNRLLATASWDKTVCLWNLDTNVPVCPPLQHDANVNSAAISPDGKLLVTSSDDENIYVWDIHTILNDTGLEHLLSIPEVRMQSRRPLHTS